MNGDAEHARHLSERRRDIVAVADERDCAAAAIAPSLAQRERVGERLARMLFVGERVDDVQVAPGGGQRRRLLLRERANDEGADPSLQVARDVLKRLARAFCERGREMQRISAQLTNRDLESRSRTQRWLFEQQGDVQAGECRRQRCLASEPPVGLHLCRDAQQPVEIVWRQIEDRQKVLGEMRRRRAIHFPRPFDKQPAKTQSIASFMFDTRR